MSGVVLLSVLLLAAFVGFAVVSKVARPLHEPLLSWAVAVHGVVLVAAVIVTGRATTGVELAAGLVATVLASITLVGGFVLALRGLPATTRTAATATATAAAGPGHRIGAAGAAVALLTVFLAGSGDLDDAPTILPAVAVGTVIAVAGTRLVRPVRTPQLVALFTGAGGGAAALVALLLLSDVDGGGRGDRTALAVAVLAGSVAFAGSVVMFLKLQEIMTARPVVLPGAVPLLLTGLAVAVGLGAAVAATANPTVGLLLLIAALILGAMTVLPVGAVDAPIVGSLQNAFTGLAVATVGFALPNTLLLVAGTLVAAAGATLTRRTYAARKGPVGPVGPENVASLLGHARKVVVVPGYGLAVAQAQHTLRELVAALEDQGVEVRYGIHPDAGRMPGQLFALLAEAGVPHEALTGPDEVNPEFATADVVLVVGANDVVNPAARPDPGGPFVGTPVLEVRRAPQVVVLGRSRGPGHAGVENELLHDARTSVLLGDARRSLADVLSAVRTR